ncbi:MAG: hypothetical protein FGM32_09230 [Candidatus Kapabacteria bacterium]|nr:hypothetical protein [Candidatus Kapabacteria bacterium]
MRIHLRTVPAALLAVFLSFTSTHAQRFDSDELWNTQPSPDTTFRRFFLMPQYGTGLHLASKLECLDGGNCTPFNGGSGSVVGVNLGVDQKIDSLWSGVVMLGLNSWNATMTTTDDGARVRMPDGSVANLVRELTMNASGRTLGLSFGALYQSSALRFVLAPLIDIALGQQWSQTGRILSPAGVAYPDGSTSTVIVPEIPIPNAAAIRFGLLASVGYELPINDQYSIIPTFTAHVVPTSIRSGSSWSDVRITGGIAIRREADDLPDTVERIRTYQKIDTMLITRQSEVGGTIYTLGQADVTADTTTDRLLKRITVNVRRTDTLVTLDPTLALRLAEERRKAEEERLKAEEDRLRREKEQRIAEEKKFQEKTPKAVITMGGKTMPLKPKRKVTVSFDTTDTKIRIDRDTTKRTQMNFYVTESGDTVNTDNIEVAEELAIRLTSERQTLTFMVMPSVFFDSNSTAIPDRYRRLTSTAGYDPSINATSQHNVNLDILNVIGKRMTETTSALIVKGHADELSEGASCQIARARAEEVAKYLTQAWGISPDRVRVETGTDRCSPNPASSGASPRGREENRRVEVLSDDLQYFQPVAKVELVVKPEWDVSNAQLQFGDSTDPVVRWVTTYRQGNRVIEVRRGEGPFDRSSLSLSKEALDALTRDPIILTFTIQTKSGEEVETDLKIPVDEFNKDIKFENLSLAMFAVRSTDLGKRDLELLKIFASKLESGDRVAVLGFSDDLGNPARNLEISKARAEVVAARLRLLRPDCVVTRVEGFASTRYPIGVTAYDTPEQRFMSRTVQLVLEKR